MEPAVSMLNVSGRWLVAQLGRMSVELAILAGIVLVALYVLRVKSPALRHLFWGLLLAKPVVTFLVASPLSLYAVLWPPVPKVIFTPPPVTVQAEPASLPVRNLPMPDVTPSAPAPLPKAPPFWRQIDRYGFASAVWMLVASVLGLRLFLGCTYVTFLRGTAKTRREGVLAETVAEVAATLRVRRRVAIATTTVCHGPVLAGIFRPVILLPETMAAALTDAQLKLVITHELAHAKRWDNLVLLVQRLAEMLFFFHPVVWLCGWMMRREAEAACDDIVVSAYGDSDGASAAAYADSLTRVAEMKCGITRRLLVNTFAAAESNFHRRIRRILSGRRTRMTLWLSLATGMALILIGVLGLPTVSSAPQQPTKDAASGSEEMAAKAKEAVEAKWDGINSYTAVIESTNDDKEDKRGGYTMHSSVSALKNADGVLMYRIETDKVTFGNPDRKGFDKLVMVYDGKDVYRETQAADGIEVRVRRNAQDVDFSNGAVGLRRRFEQCFQNETFSLLPEEEVGGKGVYVFEGRSKRSKVPPPYRLYIDKETGFQLKFERGHNRNVLNDVKLNVPVDPALFRYTPPADAKIIDSAAPEKAAAADVKSQEKRQRLYKAEFAVISVDKNAPLPDKDILPLPSDASLADAALKAVSQAGGDPGGSSGHVELLSSPSMMLVEGERGSIVVGQDIPMPTADASVADAVARKFAGCSISTAIAPEGGSGEIGIDLHVEVAKPAGVASGDKPADSANPNGTVKGCTFDSHLKFPLKDTRLAKTCALDGQGTIFVAVRITEAEVPVTPVSRQAANTQTAAQDGYTHLVTFEPAGDFHPERPGQLLDVFNGVCKARTGYFRTTPRDGKLVGRICTDDPEEIQKSLEKEPRLKWVEAVPLTPELFAKHSASKQESLTAQEGALAFPNNLSVGSLYVRPADEPFRATFEPADGGEGWRSFAEARGAVQVPAGMQVMLEVPQAGLLEHLEGLAPDALQCLSLRGTDLHDEDLAHIAKLTGLRSLDCEHNARLSDGGLVHLRAMKQLECLRLGLTGVTLTDGAPLLELGSLWYLDLNDCRLSENALDVISKLPRLRWVSFQDSNVTGAGLAKLQDCANLEGLNLCDCHVDASPVQAVTAMRNLQYLNMGNEMHVTDADMPALAGLAKLQFLSLRKNQGVTDAGAAHLAGLASLRYLDLRETGISGQTLTALKQMPNLTEVLSAFAQVSGNEAAAFPEGQDKTASAPRQASSDPNALKVGLFMSHFTATGPSWRGEPYGYEHQCTEEFADVLSRMNNDVYAVIEPGTADKGALPRILAKTGLRDKVIEVTNLSELLKLNVLVIKKCNNAIPEMAGIIRRAVEQGVGLVDIGGFGRVTPGYNAQFQDLWGLPETGYSYYLEAIDAPVLQSHPILGDLKPGDTIGIDVPDGTTLPSGAVRDGAVLLGGTDKLDKGFVTLMVHELGKGRMVMGNWYHLALPHSPWGPYGLYQRCINWAAHRPLDAQETVPATQNAKSGVILNMQSIVAHVNSDGRYSTAQNAREAEGAPRKDDPLAPVFFTDAAVSIGGQQLKAERTGWRLNGIPLPMDREEHDPASRIQYFGSRPFPLADDHKLVSVILQSTVGGQKTDKTPEYWAQNLGVECQSVTRSDTEIVLELHFSFDRIAERHPRAEVPADMGEPVFAKQTETLRISVQPEMDYGIKISIGPEDTWLLRLRAGGSSFAAPVAGPAEKSTYATPEGGYTHLVAFDAADGFHLTSKQLLEVFNGVCKAKTGCFRTTLQDGRLIGHICTDAPDEVRKAVEKEPRLKWVETEPLTADRFARHAAIRQEKSDVEEALDLPVSIEFEDIHLGEVVNFITDSYDINIDIDWRAVAPPPSKHPAEPGPNRVTDGKIPYINLKNVPLREALSALLRPLNLDFRVEPSMVWVSSPALIEADTKRPQPDLKSASENLAKAFARPVSIEFEDVHLSEIVEFISDSYDVNIVLDDRVMPHKPRTPNEPPQMMPAYVTDGMVIRINLRNTPLAEVLRALLRPLNLTFAVQPGFLWISSDAVIKAEASPHTIPESANGADASHSVPAAAGALPPVAAENFVATLADGRSIQLVSVREHRTDNKSFWRPDGTPLAEATYDPDKLAESVAGQGKAYEFAFRTKGIESDEPMQYRFEGSTGWSMAGSSDNLGTSIATVCLDAKATTENISVNVASGDWTTLITEEPLGGNGGSARGAQEYSVIFGTTYEKDGAACVTVTLEGSLSEQAVRLCAVDAQGQLHPSSAHGCSAGKARQTTHIFAGMKPQDIREFQLQTRPWQEVQFNNVSLAPDKHTDVKAFAAAVPGTGIDQSKPENAAPAADAPQDNAQYDRLVEGMQRRDARTKSVTMTFTTTSSFPDGSTGVLPTEYNYVYQGDCVYQKVVRTDDRKDTDEESALDGTKYTTIDHAAKSVAIQKLFSPWANWTVMKMFSRPGLQDLGEPLMGAWFTQRRGRITGAKTIDGHEVFGMADSGMDNPPDPNKEGYVIWVAPDLDYAPLRVYEYRDRALHHLYEFKDFQRAGDFFVPRAATVWYLDTDKHLPDFDPDNPVPGWVARVDAKFEEFAYNKQEYPSSFFSLKIPEGYRTQPEVEPAAAKDTPADANAAAATVQARPALSESMRAALSKEPVTATIDNAGQLIAALGLATRVSFAGQDMPSFEPLTLADASPLKWMEEVAAKSGGKACFVVRPYGILATSIEHAASIPGATIPADVPCTTVQPGGGGAARPPLSANIEKALAHEPITLINEDGRTNLSELIETLSIASELSFALQTDIALPPYSFSKTTAKDIVLAVSDMTQGQACFVQRDYGMLAAERVTAQRLPGASIPEDLPLTPPNEPNPHPSPPDPLIQLLKKTPTSFDVRPASFYDTGNDGLANVFKLVCGLELRTEYNILRERCAEKAVTPLCFMKDANGLQLMEAIVEASGGELCFVFTGDKAATFTTAGGGRLLQGPAVEQAPTAAASVPAASVPITDLPAKTGTGDAVLPVKEAGDPSLTAKLQGVLSAKEQQIRSFIIEYTLSQKAVKDQRLTWKSDENCSMALADGIFRWTEQGEDGTSGKFTRVYSNYGGVLATYQPDPAGGKGKGTLGGHWLPPSSAVIEPRFAVFGYVYDEPSSRAFDAGIWEGVAGSDGSFTLRHRYGDYRERDFIFDSAYRLIKIQHRVVPMEEQRQKFADVIARLGIENLFQTEWTLEMSQFSVIDGVEIPLRAVKIGAVFSMPPNIGGKPWTEETAFPERFNDKNTTVGVVQVMTINPEKSKINPKLDAADLQIVFPEGTEIHDERPPADQTTAPAAKGSSAEPEPASGAPAQHDTAQKEQIRQVSEMIQQYDPVIAPVSASPAPDAEQSTAEGKPASGPLIVAPLIGFLDDKVKAEWQAQGTSGDRDVLGRLQDQTVEIMQKRLDSAGMKDVKIAKEANGRISVQIPPAVDVTRASLLLTQPGMSRFCPTASRDEVVQALQEIEKNPSFQGRLTGLFDTKSKDYCPTVPADKHAAAEDVVGEINDARPRLLPEGKMFFLGSKSSPNTLYLIDKNSSMASVKVESALVTPDTDDPGKAKINFSFSDEDAQQFGDLTQSLAGKGLAILINWEVQSVPIVRERIAKSGQIVGNYTLEEATDIAARISVPEYPAQLLVLSDPTATPGNPEPAKVEDVRKSLETRYYSGIDEGLWNQLLCKFLVPVFDSATGEELSFAHYDKAKDEFAVRNLPDNLAAFAVMIKCFKPGQHQTEPAQKEKNANTPHVTLKNPSSISFNAEMVEGDIEKGRLTLTGNPTVSTPEVPEVTGEKVVIDTKDRTVEVENARAKETQPTAGSETASEGIQEDFERGAKGVSAWPDGWIADGNATNHNVCYVDGTTFKDTHGNTLRLQGDTPAWSPLAHFKTGVGVPFRITFDVYLESKDPKCTCVVGVRTKPSWTAPGIILFDTVPPGDVKGLEPVAEGGEMSTGQTLGQLRMDLAKWYRVELTLQEKSGRQVLSAVLNDGTTTQGPVQVSADALVKEMPYLQLEVRSGTAWFDNVSMKSMETPPQSAPAPQKVSDSTILPGRGDVVFAKDPAPKADKIPQYTAEMKLLVGPRKSVDALCADLKVDREIGHGPESGRAFITGDEKGIEVVFAASDKDADIELVSAPRVTFKAAEDAPGDAGAPSWGPFKLVLRAEGRKLADDAGQVTRAIMEEFFGDYSRSLLDFLHSEKPLAVIMNTQGNYLDKHIKGAEPKSIPEGVAMALRLDKAEGLDDFGLKFYFNRKEVIQHARGLAFWKPKPTPEIFESPVVLRTVQASPYRLGEWVIVVTKHRDPNKSTLAMLHIERAPSSGARSFEGPPPAPRAVPIPIYADPPKVENI